MNTNSINQLREHRDSLKRSLRQFKASKFTENYGPEKEYVAQGIRAGMEAILVDVQGLLKAPAKLIQKSACHERTTINNSLTKIISNLESGQLDEIARAIDEIKPILRGLDVRHSDERMEAFDEFVNSLQRDASEVSQHIVDIEAIKSEANELKEAFGSEKDKLQEVINSEADEFRGKINDVHQEQLNRLDDLNSKLSGLTTQRESLIEIINNTERKRQELSGLVEQESARSEQIKQILEESRRHEEVINNFSKNVAQRESQLQDQEAATEQYNEVLKTFKSEHDGLLTEAKELIENARNALEYSTAVGLSAAFIEQYNESNKFLPKLGWLFSAVFFVAIAVLIGYSLTTVINPSLAHVVARISLLPILIAGAWFCSGQYVKQKNIAEDYAYKAAIAKSIVGFSEKLSAQTDKGDDYFSFMRFALSQMLNDPLRKHVRKESTGFENFKSAMQFWGRKDTQ